MDFNRLDQHLRDSLVDLRLSNEERDELRELGSDLTPDQVRYLLVTDDPHLVAEYRREFEMLWARYRPS